MLSTSQIEEVLQTCWFGKTENITQNYNDQYYNNHYYNYNCTPQRRYKKITTST